MRASAGRRRSSKHSAVSRQVEPAEMSLRHGGPGLPARHVRRGHAVRAGALAVGIAVAGLAIFLALRVDSAPTFVGIKLGKPAPAFDLPTLDGGRVSLRDLRGKTVVVNFWNSWCIPCRREHPALAQFFQRHRDEPDFAMLGIVRDDTESAARAWVEAQRVEWTIALDPGSRAALDFGTTGQPETFAITPDGLVVGIHRSEARVADLEAMLARARGTG